jgi:chromosome segregation ATPase
MKELELLQQKVEQLIKQYTALKAEHERLNKKFEKQSTMLFQREEELKNTQEELKWQSVTQAATSLTSEAKEKLKLHLEQIISEIEKNIEML